MPDIATISAFLGSIKTTTDIAKTLKGVDTSLEKAELKLKIAELMESLADVKIQAVEIQEVIQAKDKRIQELEEKLNAKSKMIRCDGRYYEADENNLPIGDAYCSNCRDANNASIHLTKNSSIILRCGGNSRRLLCYSCPSCRNSYQTYESIK